MADEERRKYPRLNVRLPVTYWDLPSTNLKPTVTSNIGGGGIALYVADELAVGTKLQVELELPNPRRVVNFTGEVMWCKQTLSDGQAVPKRMAPTILVGIRFVTISPEDQQAILKYSSPRA